MIDALVTSWQLLRYFKRLPASAASKDLNRIAQRLTGIWSRSEDRVDITKSPSKKLSSRGPRRQQYRRASIFTSVIGLEVLRMELRVTALLSFRHVDKTNQCTHLDSQANIARS